MNKKLLIFAPFITHPSRSGPITRLLNTVQILRKNGYDIHYAYLETMGPTTDAMAEYWGNRLHILPYRHPSIHGTSSQRWGARLRKYLPSGNYALKQNSCVDAWFDMETIPAWKALVDSIRPDAVIVHYVYLSKALEGLPNNIHKVLDTHDRFTNRYEVAAQAGKVNDWFSTSGKEERKGLKRADTLLAISEEDCRFYQKYFDERVHYHPPFTPIQSVPETDQNTILFIGNQNAANLRAIEWFMDNCWEHIKYEIPDAELNVVGSIAETMSDQEGVNLLGRVDDLAAAYASSRVAINPVPSGSGIAIKCLEAFSYGLPVVATPEGARGLDPFEDKCLFIESDAKLFSAKLTELLQSQTVWEQAHQSCAFLLTDWNNQSEQNLLNALKA